MCRFRFFVLTVFVAVFVVACEKRDNWPEGMEPIHWDRDTCAHCGMVISDPRFAVELSRNEPKKVALKFDDIGCLIAWTNASSKKTGARPWWEEPGEGTRVWVADFNSPVDNRAALRWLDARVARYIERSSPMGFNFAAVENRSEEAIGFDEMLRRVQTPRHDGGHGDKR
ncbi:MAG: nitrous oxide reductase accessory protein NosL [Zoogloeaceae bacterium]|nr:nitrous oxide reductase accessory protein NosL [Zoogloeaceae bacterium]